MISVVIPLYNKEKQVRSTIQTVLNQSFQNFEIVVVNDGSTDNSVDEVRKIKDHRVRLYDQDNSGVSAARNKGIIEAKGEYIAFLDADDEWNSDYLQSQYELVLKYPQCQVFAVNYQFKSSEGVLTDTIVRRLPFSSNDGVLINYFEVASCSHPPLWTSAVMVKKSAIQRIGGFPVGIRSGEDLLTWARLAVQGQIAYSITAKAIFNLAEGHKISSKPSRPHDENDYVANQLIKLLDVIDTKRRKSLRRYISLWYKMKVSVFVRMEDIQNTWKYGYKSLSYNIFNFKVYLMMLMVLLPSNFQTYLKRKY